MKSTISLSAQSQAALLTVLQDSEGPGTLCDLCLSEVCRSLDTLCSRRSDGSMRLDQAPLFPQETADQLLHRMVTLGGLEEQEEKANAHKRYFKAVVSNPWGNFLGSQVYVYKPAECLETYTLAPNSSVATV